MLAGEDSVEKGVVCRQLVETGSGRWPSGKTKDHSEVGEGAGQS